MIDFRINDFDQKLDCTYRDERYAVRDNGAVIRHPRTGKRPRPTDNIWTFGKPCSQKGYLLIAGVVTHRIVATAFHGEPPTQTHVVDHIDTNRRNNRPENLRWLTRLENALLNPITVKRIELICGSVESFLEDPSKLGKYGLERNFEWMRAVSPEEAKACRQRLLQWAKSDSRPTGGSLGEWVHKPLERTLENIRRDFDSVAKAQNTARPKSNSPIEFPNTSQTAYEPIISYEEKLRALDLVMAKTPGAAQRKWYTPSEFPCCPQSAGEVQITAYAEKLTMGVVFSHNHFSTSVVLESVVSDDNQSIWVLCEKADEKAIKPWSLAKVTYENGLYVYASCGTFFMKDGAEKAFCLARGLEWSGGVTFDEHC